MLGSLRSRLLVSYLVMGGILLSVVGLSLLLIIINGSIGKELVSRRLRDIINQVPQQELDTLGSLPHDKLQPAVRRLGDINQVRTLVLDEELQILADSRVLLNATTEHELMQEISQISPDNVSAGMVRSWVWVGRQISATRTLVLLAQRPAIRALYFLVDDLIKPVFQAALLALFLAIILAWFISRQVTQPLNETVAVSRDIAMGNYDRKLPESGPDEVRELVQAINEMAERVQASQQMERDFVSNVSHELKTPLTSIQGFAQAIMDGTAAEGPARKHAAGVILQEAQRMHRLVRDLLDLARLNAGQVTFQRLPVPMADLVQGVVDRLRFKADEKQLELELNLQQLPQVVGDGDRLAQVVTNLIDNAIKYTPDGGALRITGQVGPGIMQLHVCDSGPGIPEEEQSRIFERFYRGARTRSGSRGKGVGLGLAISNEIVRAHAGELTVSSAPAQGSCFTLQLPIIHPGDKTMIRRRDGR